MLNLSTFNHNHHPLQGENGDKIFSTWNLGDMFLAAIAVIYHGIPSCRDAQKSFGKTYSLARLFRNSSLIYEK